MSKQQTAVEWLIDQLKGYEYDDKDFTFHGVITTDLVEQAKQMEKERINKAHYVGYMDGAAKKVIWDDKYYNETYGGAKWF